MKKVYIDGESLAISDLVSVARGDVQVEIVPGAKIKVERSRRVLEGLLSERKVVYGVTTGFGAFGNIPVPQERVRDLQSNLIRSHSAAVGKPVSREVTRAMMLLRANTLAKGYSGVRFQTLRTLVEMLNKRVHPLVPEKGSVGASGDLAQLSHMTLVLMGEGEAEYRGSTMSGDKALKKAGIQPVELEAKEGVALNNGTQFMTAISALAVHDSERLVTAAEIAAALSLEALNGISDAFDDRIHRVRPHRGQITTAQNIRSLIAGSKAVMSGPEAAERGMHPQDPYSLRCTPQALGAVRDTIAHVKKVVEREMNSATDNPLVFSEDAACLSGGNFHGQPIAVAMDFLAIALATVGNISERRIARLVDENLSKGLPPFLISKPENQGIESGFMAIQYTAAALASENKTLSHPASVDSIPTSANFEDFVSMGPIAARKATQILRNAEQIVAIELLCATQGADFRGPTGLGSGTRAAHRLIRNSVPTLNRDRPLHRDIETVVKLIQNEQLTKVTEDMLQNLS